MLKQATFYLDKIEAGEIYCPVTETALTLAGPYKTVVYPISIHFKKGLVKYTRQYTHIHKDTPNPFLKPIRNVCATLVKAAFGNRPIKRRRHLQYPTGGHFSNQYAPGRGNGGRATIHRTGCLPPQWNQPTVAGNKAPRRADQFLNVQPFQHPVGHSRFAKDSGR